jgi:hypothetical protein
MKNHTQSDIWLYRVIAMPGLAMISSPGRTSPRAMAIQSMPEVNVALGSAVSKSLADLLTFPSLNR